MSPFKTGGFCIPSLAVAAALAAGASAAHAGPLSGKAISAAGAGVSPPIAAVHIGTEFLVGGGFGFDFDFDGAIVLGPSLPNNSIRFNSAPTYVFSDSFGTIDDIVGFLLVDIGGGITGFDASDLSFTANSVSIRLSNSFWAANETATLQIVFAEPAAVPEPGGFALAGLALLGAAMVTRRRKA